MLYMIYGAMMVLALGLLTSISLLSLSHILMIIPVLVFLPKTNFKGWNKSTWALMALSLFIVLSIVVNYEIMVEGYKPISKSKYFFFGFLSIAPFTYYFKSHFNTERRMGILLYSFCIASTIATVLGFINIYFGFNVPHWKVLQLSRNPGVFGMVMNYAHNMAYFSIIISGMVFYRKEINKFINSKFLIFVLLVNFVGLYTSFTRGAWGGLLAGLPFFYFKNNKKWFLFAIILSALIGMMAYFTAGQAMYRADKDVSRMGQWQGAIAAFRERPVLGVGYLNYEKICTQIKYKYNLLAPDFQGHAHNNFFEILADTGILGFVAFILWLGFWFYELYKRDDVVAKIGLPFIITFIAGGLSQSTISLGINLFFIMAVYTITQVRATE